MRNRSLSAIRSLAVTLWLASSVTAADEAPLQIQIADPRPYGYVVGDVLRRSIHVDAPRPWSITSESLPKAGRIDQWLELRDAHLETRVPDHVEGRDPEPDQPPRERDPEVP